MSPPRAPAAHVLSVGLILVLAAGLWLVQRAATPPSAPTVTSAPVTYAPTVELPTAAPTEVAVTPESFYATQQAGDLATSFARATAQPFPTAGPAAVQTGAPASASARRGGLTLAVRLPKDAYLSGETGWADVSLRNDGPETVTLGYGSGSFGLTLLDAQGQPPPPWPWQPVSAPGGPPYLQAVAPGQTLTTTLTFQVVGPADGYDLWVDAGFMRASLTNPQVPDAVRLRLEAGPIPLRVLAPETGRPLFAALRADHTGWSLRVTDAAGQPPAGPLAGMFEVSTADALMSGPLAASQDGMWSGAWDQPDFTTDQLTLRAWVGAPGYITAIAQQTVPGSGGPSTWFTPYQPPPPRTFVTFAAAQAALGLPLYRLGVPAAQAALDTLQADVSGEADNQSITVRQDYRLPGGALLALSQFDTHQPYESAGWGAARYDSEAQLLAVAGQPAYLSAHFGWWFLDWKDGAHGFELRAPVAALSAAALAALAGSAHP